MALSIGKKNPLDERSPYCSLYPSKACFPCCSIRSQGEGGNISEILHLASFCDHWCL